MRAVNGEQKGLPSGGKPRLDVNQTMTLLPKVKGVDRVAGWSRASPPVRLQDADRHSRAERPSGRSPEPTLCSRCCPENPGVLA